MRGDEFDILVIGEGLSGITAAAAACQQGSRVMLASKGPGTFVLGTACIDVSGLDADASGLGTNEVEKAISFFLELTAAAGCAYEGGIEERRLVPTVMGTFAEVSLAPRSLWKGDPRGISKAVVVGIENVFAFDANFVAERLSVYCEDMGLLNSYRGVTVRLPQSQHQHWLTPLEIGSEVDRNASFREALIAALKPLARNADLLILPGILGLNSTDDDVRELEDVIGCAICELPTVPPSVTGLRLLRRLESYLAAKGTEICTGFSVLKLCMKGDQCTGAMLETPGKPRTIHAGSVILASGKFSRLLEDEAMVNAKNVLECGSVVGKCEPRHGNAIAIVSGYQAGMLANQRGVQYARQ